MDYASILKPILSYDVGSSDEANIRDVLRNGASAAAQGSRIPPPAISRSGTNIATARRLGNAEAMERFRLAHPDWPGQDELREKAETALFLTDAGADEVKAFFSTTSAADRRGQGGSRRRQSEGK